MRALPGTRRLWGNLRDQLARGIAKIRPEKSLGTKCCENYSCSEPLSWGSGANRDNSTRYPVERSHHDNTMTPRVPSPRSTTGGSGSAHVTVTDSPCSIPTKGSLCRNAQRPRGFAFRCSAKQAIRNRACKSVASDHPLKGYVFSYIQPPLLPMCVFIFNLFARSC